MGQLLCEARRRKSPDKLYDAARAFRHDGARSMLCSLAYTDLSRAIKSRIAAGQKRNRPPKGVKGRFCCGGWLGV